MIPPSACKNIRNYLPRVIGQPVGYTKRSSSSLKPSSPTSCNSRSSSTKKCVRIAKRVFVPNWSFAAVVHSGKPFSYVYVRLLNVFEMFQMHHNSPRASSLDSISLKVSSNQNSINSFDCSKLVALIARIIPPQCCAVCWAKALLSWLL